MAGPCIVEWLGNALHWSSGCAEDSLRSSGEDIIADYSNHNGAAAAADDDDDGGGGGGGDGDDEGDIW